MERDVGIEVRHRKGCASRQGGTCDCRPSYRAVVYDARARRRIQRSFPTRAAAARWRADAEVDLRRGALAAAPPMMVRDAADALIEGMRAGTIRTRSGDAYRPKTIRGYHQALRAYVLPDLGGVRLTELHRNDVQDLVERLLRRGADPSTLRNALMPLRVICRRARNRGYLVVNPTEGLELPAVRSRRDRIADPVEAAALLAAVPELDRPAWATAMYAGLRLGELQALRVEDVDLDEEVIHVRRGWDQYEGEQEPKSRAGRRRVPIARLLRPHLEAALARRPTGLVFGRTHQQPFAPRTLNRRADRAWKAARLNPIGFHECRHTFASLMIAAGVNTKALQTFMGHASITVTLDLYGHLMPGAEAEAAGLLNAYLGRYEIDSPEASRG
jgi:integrase